MAQEGTGSSYPTVGRWGVSVVPQGWNFVEGFGIRQDIKEPGYIIANISLVEDELPADKSMTEYIQKQCDLITENHEAVKIAGPQPSPFPNTEEAFLLLVRHRVKDAVDMLHVQNYVRVGTWIGIVTLTAPEVQLRALRPDQDQFVKGLFILPPAADEQANAGQNEGWGNR